MTVIKPVEYRTQSIDSSFEAEQVQFKLWRNLSASEKELMLKRVTKRGAMLALAGIKGQFPTASKEIIRDYYIRKRLGDKWANLLSGLKYQGDLMIEDPIWLALELASILSSLDIMYYVGGSVASSLQGEVRLTQDLDLIANIENSQIQPLIRAMTDQFYISHTAVEEAVNRKTLSFNVIHLTTTEKADIFVMKDDEFSLSQMSRRVLHLGDRNKSFYICTPEDTILQKLLWFRTYNSESQKQWRDILGVLKLQKELLDFDYLRKWGKKLNLTELLVQALRESGSG
ncbi:hypothetical protein [Cylindrospermopsis raciborskii]|uniref:hypothetical protein n=1 Tax=Cylindrospermopsis raciborskii TaxID=77022 RepID=UPI0022C4B2F2|nr:hypothetical protein [Cylindrospermopsis raciborskii]MCZ2200425.1 hypothetical protein [Cylindrospermopsis raciborskii PAMP2012]MCZ2205730.1 hypothetical protein [Cylindrospermopsis raciborskii PAMP2011]